MAEPEKASRYISYLCPTCGFWFDGSVNGDVLFCGQCGSPLNADPEPGKRAAGARTVLRVLVAEDSSLLRKAMVRMLNEMGCDVRDAEDGEKAIGLLDWEPEMLLTDIAMPGATGIELIRELRSRASLASVPVVVLSSESDVETVSAVMSLDVMAYVRKDQMGRKELRSRLQKCLKAAELLARGGYSRHILVAEDSSTFRSALVKLLKGMSCQVQEAKDGQQALEMLQAPEARRPDLLISDLQMPRLSGLGLLKAVRQLPSFQDLPFIMLTSHGQEELMSAAMGIGVSAYILKDQTNPTALKKQIEQCLITAAALA